jgi:glycerophosphoryl diester phosphodiesterase
LNHPFFAPPVPRLIAHRGSAGTHPENTIAAFRAAAAAGAEMVELDLWLAADGVPVVIHDETCRRTTGRPEPVCALRASELAALDAGWDFSPDRGRSRPFRGAGHGVPALREVLAALPEVRFVLEVKTPDSGIDAPLAAALREAGADRRVLLAGESGPVLRRLRESFPGVPTSVGHDEVRAFLRGGWRTLPDAVGALQVPPRVRWRRLVTRGFVEEAHRGGREVHVWTVNDAAAAARLLDLGVDGIITDFPERMMRLYRERGLRPAAVPEGAEAPAGGSAGPRPGISGQAGAGPHGPAASAAPPAGAT